MARPIHTMPEALISRPSAQAWGCTSTPGWVPYPKHIPRRHPLIDAVRRIDDPCDRPLFQAPDWKPKPSFSPPKEGYPKDVCNLDDYTDLREQEELPEGSALINVGKDTPKGINLRTSAVYMDKTCPNETGVEECCTENRTLEPTRRKYEELLPASARQSSSNDPMSCPTTCNPNNPGYPCTGIIGEIMRDPTYAFVSDKDKCLPLSIRSGQKVPDWRELKPLTGWEFINGQRTCDLYPIAGNLPGRFNNPLWFKGYGCEKPNHPFYATTTADYGRFSPNPHTMTQRFFPRTSQFTKVLAAAGMYRNRTLNTSNSKSIV